MRSESWDRRAFPVILGDAIEGGRDYPCGLGLPVRPGCLGALGITGGLGRSLCSWDVAGFITWKIWKKPAEKLPEDSSPLLRPAAQAGAPVHPRRFCWRPLLPGRLAWAQGSRRSWVSLRGLVGLSRPGGPESSRRSCPSI
jgi:hypothetical protein